MGPFLQDFLSKTGRDPWSWMASIISVTPLDEGSKPQRARSGSCTGRATLWVYMYVCVYIYIYIYIYIEREREREICVYIYIYI